ncbi:MAG: 50S ribosomal protein L30 [Terriglobia bacterium]
MKKAASKTIFVRWVRSGIGFSTHQKTMVRSLGLRHLNQTVELQDTPPVRGLVARIPHLVEIVKSPGARPLASIPEYSILAGEAPAVAPPRRSARPEDAKIESASAAGRGEAVVDEASGRKAT